MHLFGVSRTISFEPIRVPAMTSLARGLSGGLVVVFLSGTATALFAQSLADVAKKEEERRKTVSQPAKVYTNKDLNPVPGGSAPPPPAAKDADGKDAAKDPKDAAARHTEKVSLQTTGLMSI